MKTLMKVGDLIEYISGIEHHGMIKDIRVLSDTCPVDVEYINSVEALVFWYDSNPLGFGRTVKNPSWISTEHIRIISES